MKLLCRTAAGEQDDAMSRASCGRIRQCGGPRRKDTVAHWVGGVGEKDAVPDRVTMEEKDAVPDRFAVRIKWDMDPHKESRNKENMMRKKWMLAVILSISLVMGLTACGSSGDTSDTSEAETSVDTSDDADSTDLSEDDDLSVEVDDDGDEVYEVDLEDEYTPSDSAFSIDPVTVIDDETCSVIITGVDPDVDEGYALIAEVSNISAEGEYCLFTDYCFVNGVAVSAYCNEDFPQAGETDSLVIYIYFDEMEADIGDVTDIWMTAEVWESETEEDDDMIITSFVGEEAVASGIVHIYPYGEESATVYERDSSEDDAVLVEEDVSIVVTGYDTYEYDDEEFGTSFVIYLYSQNLTEQDVEVYFTIDAINDIVLEDTMCWVTCLFVGTSGFCYLEIDVDMLDQVGLSDISEIESVLLYIEAYSTDDLTTEDYEYNQLFEETFLMEM